MDSCPACESSTPMRDKAGSRIPSGDDGFTIIEVMIAMLIMIIGVLGTFVLEEGQPLLMPVDMEMDTAATPAA